MDQITAAYPNVAKLESQAGRELLAVMMEQMQALAAENVGLNSFVDALLSIAWQGGSADGADIEELALKHGLIRQEVYSQDDHENLVDDPGNFEEGDPVYFRVETPATDRLVAEMKAQGVEMFALMFAEEAIKDNNITTGWKARASRAASEYAEQLREVGQ
ncbi:hypothetical protein ACLBW0_08530 [Enterobacteriaceae bacterium C34A]